jgi:hypothetical protein
MTGAELFKVRQILGISQASAAASIGMNTVSGSGGFTATDISTAEGSPGTIANSALNISVEKFFRPTLNTLSGV